MEMLQQILHSFLHLDQQLKEIIGHYGVWTYAILFLIVFCETGLVVTPFLPGDSLLFAAGALAGTGALNPLILIVTLTVAAILGDCVNYTCGHLIGPRVFRYEKSWLFRKDHLERTHQVFEKYGAKTIVIARFLPIVRTFAPFLAGVGRMTYSKFLAYNVVGGFTWVVAFILAGYLLGQFEFVKRYFTLVVLGIIVLSVIPPIIEYFRAHKKPTGPAAPARPLDPANFT